jgi:hypothetical protein
MGFFENLFGKKEKKNQQGSISSTTKKKESTKSKKGDTVTIVKKPVKTSGSPKFIKVEEFEPKHAIEYLEDSIGNKIKPKFLFSCSRSLKDSENNKYLGWILSTANEWKIIIFSFENQSKYQLQSYPTNVGAEFGFIGDERIFVVHHINGSLKTIFELFETATGKKILEKEIETDKAVSIRLMDVDHQRARILFRYFDNFIYLVDVHQDEFLYSKKPAGLMDYGPIFSPDGKVYFTKWGGGIAEIDTWENKICEGAHCIAFSSEGDLFAGGGVLDNYSMPVFLNILTKDNIVSKIPWNAQPISQIEVMGNKSLLITNISPDIFSDESFSTSIHFYSYSEKKTLGRIFVEFPRKTATPILGCSPEESWAIVPTMNGLCMISFPDGEEIWNLKYRFNKSPLKVIWLKQQRLLAIYSDVNNDGRLFIIKIDDIKKTKSLNNIEKDNSQDDLSEVVFEFEEPESEIIIRFNDDNPRIICSENFLTKVELKFCKKDVQQYSVNLLPYKGHKKSSIIYEILKSMPISDKEHAFSAQDKWSNQNNAEYSKFSGSSIEILEKVFTCIYNDEKGLGLSKDDIIDCQSYSKDPFDFCIQKTGGHHIFRIGEDEYLYVSHRYIW